MKKMTAILLALIVATVITLLACGNHAEEAIQIETEPTTKVEATTKETEHVDMVPVTDNSSDSVDREPKPVPERTEETTEEETTLSAEELAQICLNEGINGPDREAFLGERYGEVQGWLEENYVPPYVPEPEGVGDYFPTYGGDVLTPDAGINYYNGVLETYYNMDMSGVVDWMHQLGYEGDYWVRSDGVKMFGNYVMVASDYDYEPKGTITETSLGLGIVCDTGLGGWAWHDIAVDW